MTIKEFKEKLTQKQYMIIDVTDPKTNLVSGIGEAYIQDLRKLKKIKRAKKQTKKK